MNQSPPVELPELRRPCHQVVLATDDATASGMLPNIDLIRNIVMGEVGGDYEANRKQRWALWALEELETFLNQVAEEQSPETCI